MRSIRFVREFIHDCIVRERQIKGKVYGIHLMTPRWKKNAIMRLEIIAFIDDTRCIIRIHVLCKCIFSIIKMHTLTMADVMALALSIPLFAASGVCDLLWLHEMNYSVIEYLASIYRFSLVYFVHWLLQMNWKLEYKMKKAMRIA